MYTHTFNGSDMNNFYSTPQSLSLALSDIATIEIVWMIIPLTPKKYIHVHWNVSILHFNFRSMDIEFPATPLVHFFSYFFLSISIHFTLCSRFIVDHFK